MNNILFFTPEFFLTQPLQSPSTSVTLGLKSSPVIFVQSPQGPPVKAEEPQPQGFLPCTYQEILRHLLSQVVPFSL